MADFLKTETFLQTRIKTV